MPTTFAPTVPWYRLPGYYKENISNDPVSIIPFRKALGIYHKHRVHRVTHHGGPYDNEQDVMQEAYLNAARSGHTYGGNAVSFLTSF